MHSHPNGHPAWVRNLVWVALIYSGAISAVAWLTPLWQNSTQLQAVFGAYLLAPVVLLLSLMVVGLGLDILALLLTLVIVAKTRTKLNILICVVALVILIAPIVVDSVYSAGVASGASS